MILPRRALIRVDYEALADFIAFRLKHAADDVNASPLHRRN